MAQRDRRRMKPSPLHLISAETAQLDNATNRVLVASMFTALSSVISPSLGSRDGSIKQQQCPRRN
jgi:hypothetical protein